jgi:hypothetical protein
LYWSNTVNKNYRYTYFEFSSASDEWLIYGNVLSVEKINLNTMVTETIARGFKDIEDVDVCYSKGFVFWADPIAQNIMR